MGSTLPRLTDQHPQPLQKLADTIRPRLDAAGADVSRVHHVQATRVRGGDGTATRQFALATDVGRLERTADRLRNLKLIGLDPLDAYLGECNSFRGSDVRAVLTPFVLPLVQRLVPIGAEARL